MTSVEEREPLRLGKGQNASLRDLDEELGSVTVVLETGDPDGETVDADVSVLLLGEDGRVRSNDDFVFYNNRVAIDGAIHLRDKLRTTDAGQAISADVVTLQLDDIPDDVHRIVLAASLDESLGLTFNAPKFVRLRVQRTSDAKDLITYDIEDVTDELALIFGEFYRRRGEWKIRAIGQGYSRGLASLVTDFGIDVEADATGSDGESAGGWSATAHAQDGTVDDPDDSARDEGTPAPPAGSRVSVRRDVRAPRMPATWNKTIPSDGEVEWHAARLFPVAGIGGSQEQERRATSALLAVMGLVRPFGKDLCARVGAPGGLMQTFIEVTFGRDDEAVRPDGVIQIKWGQRTWSALVEVKTSDGKLASPQIEAYLDVAKARGYDAVLTISNQLTDASGTHPVIVDRRKLRKVALHHLAWDEIRCRARILTQHQGLADATQQRVLEEFLRYTEHPRSGMGGFEDMGPRWVTVRDAVKARTQRANDRSTAEISDRFDQLARHAALKLSGLLGVEVLIQAPPDAPDAASRTQQLADSGLLFGSLRVPGAAGTLVVTADLRSDRVTCAMAVPAPKEGRPLTRVNWLLRQLSEARDAMRVESVLGGREKPVPALLGTARKTPATLVPDNDREIKAFQVSLDLPLGAKRGTGSGSFIDSVVGVTHHFYAEVGQYLRPWSKKARPPKLSEEPN